MSYLKHTNSNMSKRMYAGGGEEPMPRPEMFPNPQMYQQALREYFSRNFITSQDNRPDIQGQSIDEQKFPFNNFEKIKDINQQHPGVYSQHQLSQGLKGNRMLEFPGSFNDNPNRQDIDMTIDRTSNVQSDKVQPQSLLKSKTKAQSFNKAFAEARQAGKKTFKWNGNVYGTQLKGEGKSKEQQSIDNMQYDDVLTNNDNRQSPNGPNRQFAMGGNDKPRYWVRGEEPPYREDNMMNPNPNEYDFSQVGQLEQSPYAFTGNNSYVQPQQSNKYLDYMNSQLQPQPVYAPNPRKINETPNVNINTSLLTKPTMKELPTDTRTGTPDTSFNGSDWTQGLSYLGQSAPAIYNAMMMNKPVEKEVYPLSNPYLVNNTEERRQINENADTANNVTIRNLKNENVSSYASNVGSALSGIQRNRGNQLGQSYQTQEQQNANIINQSRNTNNMIKMQEVIANAQNRALKQGFGAKLAEQVGMLAGQVGADMSKKKMDKYTLRMLQTGDYKFNDKGDIIDKENNVVMTEFELNGTKIKTTKHKKLFGGTRSKFV